MTSTTPGVVELHSYFKVYQGPRCQTAGPKIQFHYNQQPGIHFKVEPPQEFRESIVRGLNDGLALRFPDFPESGSVWIVGLDVDEIDSSEAAFYIVARLIIEQAFIRVQLFKA